MGDILVIIGESPGPYPHCAYSKIRHSITIQSIFDYVILPLLTSYRGYIPRRHLSSLTEFQPNVLTVLSTLLTKSFPMASPHI